ncbi:MAG: hypothetical protein J1D87_09230 [Lachnospiraceae bacterium]|nr:hypothetical protein [Lachnospiraceae bacterium]
MWEIVKTANGRKSCDNFELDSSDILSILSVIEKYYVIDYDNRGALGQNVAAFDLQIDGKYMTIGWDNWSGIFIMSHDPSGDILVERIYEILKG